MNNRRNFLKASTLSIAGAPFISIRELFSINSGTQQSAIVKQSEDCEIFYVRENTPITFNVSKNGDNVSSVSLLTEELIPGNSIPIHKHLFDDEYFFFITGSGSMSIEDKTYAFKAGTTAFVPKNTWHGIKNTGSDKVILCFGFSPAGFEGFFREVGTPKGQVFKQKTKDELDIIAKKYGMVFK